VHSPSPPDEPIVGGRGHVRLSLDGFARETLEQESARLGVPVEEVAKFAVLYYLADLDSGRISREISASPFGQEGGHAPQGTLGATFPQG
jgi:hypothetical protein